MKQPRALLLIFCITAISFLANAADILGGWEFRARDPRVDVQFDPDTGIATAPGGVMFTYKDVVLTAEKVIANEKAQEVTAEGDVTIKWSEEASSGNTNTVGNLWRGQKATYNFKTRELLAGDFKTGRDPFFIKGGGVAGNQTNKLYAAVDVDVTTDNYAVPAYKLRARKLFLFPGEFFEAEDVTLYLGDVPVFYLPHYKRTLKRHPNNFEFTPGYRSLWGPYLLSTYNWYANPHLDGSIHFDMRARRGLAAGPDFNYDAGKFGQGSLQYYFADDGNPIDINGSLLPEHRQRLRFNHFTEFDTNTTFKAVVRYQSDPFVVRDFFESEYRKNVQPNTFAEFNHLWPNWTFDVLVQPQVNDFFETVERLPDLKLNGLRQQIGITPLYYESESSLGYFQRKFAFTNLFAQPDFEAFRGDTYHQVTLPQTYFGWLNFTPRVGYRFTYYNEAHGLGATNLHEEARSVFNTGAELSLKASRVWNGAESKLLDVHGLRHTFEPSVNYVFVPAPNARPPELPQFDYELPSLRLLPIDFPDYNSIDSIDSQNVLRFALRNKLQTKRADGVENLVNWALYTDWRLDPRTDWGKSATLGVRTNQGTFADLFSDLDIRPRSWLTFNSEIRYDLNHPRLREANHRLAILPNDTWTFAVGFRYLADDPALREPFAPLVPISNKLFYDTFYIKLNENWAYRMSHFYEARNGTMQEQYYTLYRDLRSWTAAFTLRFRSGVDDFGFAVTFSLKAFPRFRLGADRSEPALLLGN